MGALVAGGWLLLHLGYRVDQALLRETRFAGALTRLYQATTPDYLASQGIAYGQIFVYLQTDVEVPSYQVEPEKRIDEVARFDRALVATRQQISKIKNEVEKNLGPEEAMIFDAHLLVLEDQALIDETIRDFETTGRNIETCFHRVSSRYVQAFSEIDDEYLRERAGDLRDVTQQHLAVGIILEGDYDRRRATSHGRQRQQVRFIAVGP